MPDNKVEFKIVVDAKSGAAEIRQFGGELDAAAKRGEKAFQGTTSSLAKLRENFLPTIGLASKLGAVFGGYQLAKLAGDFISVAASMQQYETTLGTVLKSSKKAEESMAWIEKFAASTPFEIPGLVEATVRLEAYGLNAQKYLKGLGDTAASMGKPIMSAVEMIADASQGEFERMKEFGLRATDVAAKAGFKNVQGMTSTRENLVKGTETLMSMLEQRYAGGMERLSKNWVGMISNIKDLWFQFQKAVMDAGVFEYLSAWLKTIQDYINDLKAAGQFEAWASSIATSFITAFEWIVKGAALVGDAFRGWEMIWQGLKMAFAAWASFVLGIYDKIISVIQKLPWIGEADLFANARASIAGTQVVLAGISDESERNLEVLIVEESYYESISKWMESVRELTRSIGKEAGSAASAQASIMDISADLYDAKVQDEYAWVDAVKDALDDVVDMERQAADERAGINDDLYSSRSDGSEAGTGWSAALPSGAGHMEYDIHWNIVWVSEPLKEAAKAMKGVEENTSRLVSYASTAEQRDIERLQREREQAINQFRQQQAQLSESLFSSAGSIADAMASLYGSAAAPVQGASWYGARYTELYTGAMGDQGKLQDMLGFVDQYLSFFGTYGGNYTAIFGSVVEDLERLKSHYETMGWLAGIGIGDTASDINQLVEAFNALGVSTEELKGAAIDTAGDMGIHGLGSELMNTKTPFANVISALASVTGSTKDKLISIGNMWQTLVTGIGGSMGSVTSTIQNAYNAAQANPTITYQGVTVRGYYVASGGYQTQQGWMYIWTPTYAGRQIGSGIMSISNPSISGFDYVVYGPAGAGAYTKGVTLAGEMGPEWIVPTYEPERSRFLKDVGADPDAVGLAIARRLGPLMEGNAGGEIHVHLHVGEAEIAHVVANQFHDGNGELIREARRRLQ